MWDPDPWQPHLPPAHGQERGPAGPRSSDLFVVGAHHLDKETSQLLWFAGARPQVSRPAPSWEVGQRAGFQQLPRGTGSQAHAGPAQCFPESMGGPGLGAREGGALLQGRPLRHKGLRLSPPGPNFLRGDRSGPREPSARQSRWAGTVASPGSPRRAVEPRLCRPRRSHLCSLAPQTQASGPPASWQSHGPVRRDGERDARRAGHTSEQGTYPSPARPVAAWGSPPAAGHTEGGRTRQNSRLLSMTG